MSSGGRRPNTGGARPGAGRPKRDEEQEYLAAFKSVVSPKKFKEMTERLLEIFYDEFLIYDKDGQPFEVKVDPQTRARIWEKFAAYGIGMPVQRVETGEMGAYKKYLETVSEFIHDAGEGQSDEPAKPETP